jgi:hypothetical protein
MICDRPVTGRNGWERWTSRYKDPLASRTRLPREEAVAESSRERWIGSSPWDMLWEREPARSRKVQSELFEAAILA